MTYILDAATIERLRESLPLVGTPNPGTMAAVNVTDLTAALQLIASAAIIAKEAKVWSPDTPNPLYDLFNPDMMNFELP
jgi:hypothetical protein